MAIWHFLKTLFKNVQRKLCNESYWHCTVHGKNKKSWLFWQKQCSEMSNTLSARNVIWSVHWFMTNWVRQGAPFCLMCILVHSLHNNFWKLCLISVKNVGNDQLNLIHCGDSQKNMRGETGYSQKLFFSLYQQNLHRNTCPWKHWHALVTCTQKRAWAFAVQESCPLSRSSHVP